MWETCDVEREGLGLVPKEAIELLHDELNRVCGDRVVGMGWCQELVGNVAQSAVGGGWRGVVM